MRSRSEARYIRAAITALVLFPVAWNFARAVDEPTGPASISVRTEGAWTIVESPNFRCRSQLLESDAKRLADCCEAWRSRLQTIWLKRPSATNWQPKCDVCVHRDKSAYNLALGRPGDVSVGSTVMSFDEGRAVRRLIHVRSDADDWSNAALPHELTHVVLGERFGGHALPRWADEGIAILSESPEKHRERLANLKETISRGQTLTLNQLIHLDRVPPPHQRDAFYGQSVALTSWLIKQATPAQFADFIEDSQHHGINFALKRNYSLDDIASLQTKWDQWIHTPETLEFVRLQLQSGLPPIIASTNRVSP